jgi:hypothetical protein
MRAEYRFTYAKVQPNRFANRMKHGAFSVILDPGVAAVFSSLKAVNEGGQRIPSLRYRNVACSDAQANKYKGSGVCVLRVPLSR